ncbi:hypothetical protein TVAG_009150 [Trichomonas vaginalis G3]|uniref:CNH domain-containing protein n=1 Tax=Trichomonas vaginalis (strain ATCC PRA-98 / G3) TaxID=412133 RepID=A2G549_TRIV3|nr:hypothetical protein TVAGG3_0251190 [Trichomonas vaginalis G3]EAX87710.1 hypothetical protein TVAG_009150 [Trichomonas vaginalis G3]KAI5554015.1 hypothetical protein TVAGG3_0251190 [Trichomonas vaginalis G3]|eukprot:XP_001300640.1 hypothetical protein [Trichomonas vaginalis G3]
MSGIQARPPLLSLKVRRTVDTILSMNPEEQKERESSNTPVSKVKDKKQQTSLDHSSEIEKISGILEQQSFYFVAFRNQIQDAQRDQAKIMQKFHETAQDIDKRMNKMKEMLMKKVVDLNKRVSSISRNLALKPTFRKMLPQNNYGRITGISVCGETLLCTSADGWLLRIDRHELNIKHTTRYSTTEALFQPTLFSHGNIWVELALTSTRNLLIRMQTSPDLERCSPLLIESYAVNTDPHTRDAFEVILGENSQIEFCSIAPDASPKLQVVSTTKKIRGTVTSIVVDQNIDAIFAITSRRTLYCISATNYQIVLSELFDKPIMQLFTTQCFIILSIAPNDIILLEKNREKANKLFQINISAGLRRFFAAENDILIIKKDQQIERRRLCNVEISEPICEADAADFNEEEYIGLIIEYERQIYLTHGNRISYWT